MSRPSLDEYLMSLALIAARRTTCIRRGVGCVLANARGHVLSISYNGVAAGLPHCNSEALAPFPNMASHVNKSGKRTYFPNACVGHDLPPGQDNCEAVHAEQNALLQCRDPNEISTAYVTLSPCKPCVKLLLNTPCQRIVFYEEHATLEAYALWVDKAGREWINLSEQRSAYLQQLTGAQ